MAAVQRDLQKINSTAKSFNKNIGPGIASIGKMPAASQQQLLAANRGMNKFRMDQVKAAQKAAAASAAADTKAAAASASAELSKSAKLRSVNAGITSMLAKQNAKRQSDAAKTAAAMSKSWDALTKKNMAAKNASDPMFQAKRLGLTSVTGPISSLPAPPTRDNSPGMATAAWQKFTGVLSGVGAGISGVNQKMISFGKNAQWTGRQLEMRFTLPLVALGAIGFKALMGIEKEQTRLNKVYGDGSMAASQFTAETGKLAKANRLLSEIYAVQQEEVTSTMADWAAAGATGGALILRTEQSLQLATLGEMDLASATEALLTITQAYGLTVADTSSALETLNMIENNTAAQFPDLIEGIQKAGSTARTTGVDIRHLGAMVAALVPEAATAERAGTALNSIMARIAAPTKEASDAFAAMGVNMEDAAWKNGTMTDKLNILATAYGGLTQAQKIQAARDIANIQQLNRLIVLLDAINDKQSAYNRALDTSADAEKNRAQAVKELNMVLQSDPKKFQRSMIQLQNALADIIIPIMPAILKFASAIANLAASFAKLKPSTQVLIVFGAAAVAAVGPIMSYVGALMILFGTIGSFLVATVGWVVGMVASVVTGFAGMLVTAILGWADIIAANAAGSAAAELAAIAPWIFLAAALVVIVAGIVFLFRKEIGDVINWIGSAFNKLPGAIAAAFRAVISVLQKAMHVIIDLLSYLNPFARHSPSLVDNVIAGVDLIAKKYASLKDLGNVFEASSSAFDNFNATTEPTRQRIADKKNNETRGVIAGDPGAVAAFDQLLAMQKVLEGQLKLITAEYAKQSKVVDQWTASVKAANDALDAANVRLDELKDAASTAGDALSDAKSVLDDLYNTPIEGMTAADDAIFDNEMAIKKLRLEMLKLKQAGESAEDLSDRMARLNGEMEGLRGREKELVHAGAGSDILGPVRDRIQALEAQRKSISNMTNPLDELQKQLDELQAKGEILDLEKAIKFDPLTRQIDKLKDSLKELPFDELYKRIVNQKGVVADLTVKYDAANLAVKNQEAAVKALTAARDAAQAGLDREKATLDLIGDTYDAIKSKIDEMESALSEFSATAAETAALANDGDFQVEAKNLMPEDIDMDKVITDLQDKLKAMFDPVHLKELFQEKWKLLKDWLDKRWDEDIQPWISSLWGRFEDWLRARLIDMIMWLPMKFVELSFAIEVAFRNGLDALKDAFSMFINWMRENVPGFALIMDAAAAALNKIFDFIGRIATGAMNTWDAAFAGMKIAGQGLWDAMKGIFNGIGGTIKAGINVGIKAINGLLGGIDKVLEFLHLPRLTYRITELGTSPDDFGPAPREFAAGGALPTRVGAGFMTRGARAIVGEGNPAYPEFVIPTDPAHRKRAMELTRQLNAQMGMKRGGTVPMLGAGDIIGGAGDLITGAVDAAEEAAKLARKAAVMGIMAGPLKAFDLAISPLSDDGFQGMVKGTANYAKNSVYNWAKGAANGALVHPTAGGSLVNVGEGGKREAIVPLPNSLRIGEDGMGKTFNFYGDLSFPNITSGDDAEEFIRNLETLASD